MKKIRYQTNKKEIRKKKIKTKHKGDEGNGGRKEIS